MNIENMKSEFDIIELLKLTSRTSISRNLDIKLGIGDDCAIFSNYAISTDLLIEHVHFFSDVNPYNLGHKSLAVNLSDLAAIGAKPHSFLLGLSLPNINNIWLKNFSHGIINLANIHNCQLIGGDTTSSKSNIVISITVIGTIDSNLALKRSNAQINDDIWISGLLGNSRLALEHKLGKHKINIEDFNICLKNLELPTPRLELGQNLCGIANAAIDISDGLLSDLEHILKASKVSAIINWQDIPISEQLSRQNIIMQKLCALNGGDDYELCFTAQPIKRNAIIQKANQLGIKISHIGNIIANNDKNISNIQIMENNQMMDIKYVDEIIKNQFKHF